MNGLKHDIDRYLKGEMSPEEMYAIERKALDDPFLADALEGSSTITPTDFSEDVAALEKKVLPKPKSIWFWPARIAAAITVLAVFTFILWPPGNDQTATRDLALQEEVDHEAVEDTDREPVVEEFDATSETEQEQVQN
jgi:hypothetical protein